MNFLDWLTIDSIAKDFPIDAQTWLITAANMNSRYPWIPLYVKKNKDGSDDWAGWENWANEQVAAKTRVDYEWILSKTKI